MFGNKASASTVGKVLLANTAPQPSAGSAVVGSSERVALQDHRHSNKETINTVSTETATLVIGVSNDITYAGTGTYTFPTMEDGDTVEMADGSVGVVQDCRNPYIIVRFDGKDWDQQVSRKRLTWADDLKRWVQK